MKSTPIIFINEMFTAILEGRKTQTRRVVKPQPISPEPENEWYPDAYNHEKNWNFWGKRGTPKANCASLPQWTCPFGIPGDILLAKRSILDASGKINLDAANAPIKTLSAKLSINKIRMERLQNISEEDAKAEGVEPQLSLDETPSYLDGFYWLWQSLYFQTEYGLDSNPWVWVVGFEVANP